MKACLNCQKGFEYKRAAAKFCSDKCRVMYNRKNPSNAVTKTQMQVLYNSMMEAIKVISSQALYDGPKLSPNYSGDEPLSFHRTVLNDAKEASPISYMSLLNGMSGVLFADEKEEYAQKILAATHLSEKQRDTLLAHLRTKN